MTAPLDETTTNSASNTAHSRSPSTPVSAARDAVSRALDTTLGTARDAGRQASAGIESRPLAALVGGAALGVLAGAALPRTQQETKLLGPLGRKLTDQASGAFKAAREAGRGELDLAGLNPATARDQAGKVIEGVLKAIATAGAAAMTTSSAKGKTTPAQ